MKWLANSMNLMASAFKEIDAMPADVRDKGWLRVSLVVIVAASLAALAGCSDSAQEKAEKAAQEQAQKEADKKAALKEAFNVGDPTQNKHKGFKGGWPPAGDKKEAQK